MWPYAGLNFGEHIRFEVVWQVAVQIVKLGFILVVVACVCVRGWAQQGHRIKNNFQRAFAQVANQIDFQVVLHSYILIGE